MPDNRPPVTGKYIDPLVDFAFKKIFGSEPNKDLLIAFLNEVFRGRKHYSNMTKEEKTMYDSSLKYKWDNKNVLDYALKEGIEKGKLEGELEKAREIARELKKEGLSIDFIAKTTKLSVEEIEKL